MSALWAFGEEGEQWWIYVEVFSPGFHLLEETEIDQGLEIDGCGLSLGDPCGDQVADPAVGMDEDHLGKKRRTRRTGKEVQLLVEEFISGAMKRSEFCRSRGLSPGTLRRHLEGGKRGARQTPRLVAVELEEKTVPKPNAIEVVLGRGRRVEVRPGFDAATLQALIAVLERV